jgi:diguanylate cyclase (GGDEF)-like protein/PAS domain S-box-containing protein/putative nucleotidyltransferase with HDIG domain
LLLSSLFAAKFLGLIPDPEQAARDGRRALCESIAITSSVFAARGEHRQMEAYLEAIVARNSDVLSAAVRRGDQEVLVETDNHHAHWEAASAGRCSATNIVVPIAAKNRPWGAVEVSFKPVMTAGPLGIVSLSQFHLFCFVASLCALLFYFFLRKTLEQLDPSRVVPQRVRAALDTLAEGLLVLDNKDRIVLANRAFADTIGRRPEELQGSRASSLQWLRQADVAASERYPWEKANQEKTLLTGVQLKLQREEDERTFLVNSSPIVTSKGENRGVLATFEDVTTLEAKHVELRKTLERLQSSRREIERQNKELKFLATRDPLTGCLNRRSFFEEFDKNWSASTRYGFPLSCVMVDIDFFKSINDEHGHGTGDMVLKKVATALQRTARKPDVVCRYGGEEFCVLLPHVDLEDAGIAAERFRKAIEDLKFPGVSVTASLGVSAISAGAPTTQDLLNQADTCLYVAKRGGRNQVVCWDESKADVTVDESKVKRQPPKVDEAVNHEIPFHAVTALVSALAYRDAATAGHSTRVADLCVATARGLMSVSDTYILEMAALLHDIGKIGVPDAILLKPGPLTEEEWRVMSIHDQIGVEILRSSFTSPKLAEIVETHHAFYGGEGRNQGLPTGEDIPLGARVLTIADAYDAMVSDRVYRKGRTPEEAFAELRRCAGTQFDPRLVETFIAAVQEAEACGKSTVPAPSKEAALQIGTQIEQLAKAVDRQDMQSLHALAGRLKATTAQLGVAEISDVAARLERSVDDDAELGTLVSITHELLDLCRATQKAYVDTQRESNEPGGNGQAADMEEPVGAA